MTPRIGEKGNITHNKQVHDIDIEAKSLLARIVLSPRLSVNSVHWMAPDINSKPPILIVSATAVQNDAIAPGSRDGTGKMQPDEKTVEAFETEFGVPVIGVQYHPEAYNKNDYYSLNSKKHHDILLYMAKTGDAFNQKQKVLTEFKEGYKPLLFSNQGTSSTKKISKDKIPSRHNEKSTKKNT